MQVTRAEAEAKFGSTAAAARALGIPRTTFRRMDDAAPVNTEQANGRNVLCLYDIHAPYEDRRAIDTAINHTLKRWEPTDIVLGGDFADLFEFSNFASTPKMHPDEELDYCIRFLESLRHGFPRCRFYYLMGNHEMRLLRYIQTSAPKLARLRGTSIDELLELGRMNIRFMDNKERWEKGLGFFKIGHLQYIHGHELGGCGYKYTEQRMAETYRANVIYGHLHSTGASRPMRDLDGHIIRTWQVGCLYTTLPHYKPGASHNLGWAVVDYDDDNSGGFTVHNYLIDDTGKVRR